MGLPLNSNTMPNDATKASHKSVRDQYKAVVLGVNYGMGEQALADRIERPIAEARNLLRRHRETYRTFWRWVEAAVDVAMTQSEIRSVFGWPLHVGPNVNPRTLLNFPMQANGAEMLRLACCLATERGIQVCAPIHDAVLICAPLERLEADVTAMRGAMAEASRVVLDGFELGTDAELVRWPDRYMDPRGVVMWAKVMELLEGNRRAVCVDVVVRGRQDGRRLECTLDGPIRTLVALVGLNRVVGFSGDPVADHLGQESTPPAHSMVEPL